MMRRHDSRGRVRGFTLVELILASFISLLVIAGIYLVYQGHSRVFAGQRAVSEVQTSTRFAMEMVKSDLQRAGFMGVGDSTDPITEQSLCGRPDPGGIDRIVAVDMTHAKGFVHLPLVNLAAAGEPAATAPDEVVLTGNFVNADTYWVHRRVAQNFQLQDTTALDPNDPFPPCEPDFDRIFEPDLNVARVIYARKIFMSRISTINYGTESVSVVTAPDCGPNSLWDGARFNVMQKVRYRVISPVAEGRLTDEEDTAAGGVGPVADRIKARTALVREFLSWDDDSVVRSETVAENVVDFQVWFLFDDPTATEQLRPEIDQRGVPFPDTATGGPPCDNGALGTSACMASNIYGAVVRLSVRTELEDPNFIHPGAATRRPLSWYEVLPNERGAARVRTLVSQVDLPNIRYGP